MTLIHHITHIANLPAIIREGAIVCDVDAERRELCAQSIAYDQIKDRRRRRAVATLAGRPLAAGGTLPDYVPFYFSNRTPMLGAINQGLVPAYQGGQADVVYLVSSAEAVAATEARWCFTDGHAVEAVSEFFDDLGNLNKIDWAAIGTWRWGGRWLLDNPDVKRRKQAEFLVHGRFPWSLVERVVVLDDAMSRRVQAALAGATHRPQVTTEPNWYFNR
jgi:hypothetical protein